MSRRHGGGSRIPAPNRNKTFPEKNSSIYAPPLVVCFTQLIQIFRLIGRFLGFVQFVIQMSQPVSGWHRIIEPEPEPEQHLSTDSWIVVRGP